MKVATFTLLAMFVLSPAVSLFPEPAQKDVPAEVENARRALRNARDRTGGTPVDNEAVTGSSHAPHQPSPRRTE